MGYETLMCSSCGSKNVDFDIATRRVTCHQCGQTEFLSRKKVDVGSTVANCRENALNFFVQGQYENALGYAKEVLDISIDDGPALYIVSFYNEVVARHYGALKDFFVKVQDVLLDYDGVEDIKTMMLSQPYVLLDYEEQVIELIAKNCQAANEKEGLSIFFDELCPYLVGKRNSMDFLKDSLIEKYKELAGYCGIPKTCYALMVAITKNPDSPYKGNTFFLKTKTEMFYNKFVVPIGEIINSMQEGEYKTKFLTAYGKMNLKLKQDAGI